MTELGHEVMVIAPDLGVREHHGAQVVGIRPVTLPFYNHHRFTLPTPTVDGIIRGYHPDVVHAGVETDRKSTRLNSSHAASPYRVFCLKNKNKANEVALNDPRHGTDVYRR